MIHHKTRLILASASPRRRALLKTLGIAFTVMSAVVDEEGHILGRRFKKPSGLARSLALHKAMDVGKKVKAHAVVIAADTIVVMGGRVIGKPKDRADARRVLRSLSGRTHEVITGVCLLEIPSRRRLSFHVTTRVTMTDMTDADIDRYIGTGEPMDKAGAYGIQGRGGLFVKRISGSYSNVVGLPLAELYRHLKAFTARM